MRRRPQNLPKIETSDQSIFKSDYSSHEAQQMEQTL